jgi:hypothetical protein
MMRFFAALVVTCALPQAALAATQDCKTIADPALRLTCYDKINPPVATYPIPLPKPSRPLPAARFDGSGPADTQNADAQDDGDAAVRAQMRNICRGC